MLALRWSGKRRLWREGSGQMQDLQKIRIPGFDDRLGMEVREQEGDENLKVGFLAHVAECMEPQTLEMDWVWVY